MTTSPELEASLRQLFLDHEHMADDEAAARIAAEAQRMVRMRRQRQIFVSLVASVAVIVGALGALGTLQLPGNERTGTPAAPATLPTGPLGDALRTFEASWSAAKPPKLIFLAPFGPDIHGGTTTEDKLSLNGRLVTTDTALPGSWPTNAVLRWSQGPTANVPVLSPTQALDEIARVRPVSCKTCAPRVVTGARLITTTLPTTTGEVQLPAWEFSLEGTTATVVMPAIDAAHVVQPVPEALSAPWPGAQSARVSASGRELTLTFSGGSPDCDRTYTASHARSEHALAVRIEQSSHTPCGGPQPAVTRQVTIQLEKPLGDVTVLDARDGNPIPVQR